VFEERLFAEGFRDVLKLEQIAIRRALGPQRRGLAERGMASSGSPQHQG
jgi:hypothetical protein